MYRSTAGTKASTSFSVGDSNATGIEYDVTTKGVTRTNAINAVLIIAPRKVLSCGFAAGLGAISVSTGPAVLGAGGTGLCGVANVVATNHALSTVTRTRCTCFSKLTHAVPAICDYRVTAAITLKGTDGYSRFCTQVIPLGFAAEYVKGTDAVVAIWVGRTTRDQLLFAAWSCFASAAVTAIPRTSLTGLSQFTDGIST